MTFSLLTNKLAFVLASVFIAAAVGLLAAWLAVATGVALLDNFPTPAQGRWQAVFLTNGQVYFGRLQEANHGYAVLAEVYYLRAAGDLQQGAGSGSQNLNLVKLGGELHGPEDALFIPKDKIQFWENLKPASEVVRAIEGAGGKRNDQ